MLYVTVEGVPERPLSVKLPVPRLLVHVDGVAVRLEVREEVGVKEVTEWEAVRVLRVQLRVRERVGPDRDAVGEQLGEVVRVTVREDLVYRDGVGVPVGVRLREPVMVLRLSVRVRVAVAEMVT